MKSILNGHIESTLRETTLRTTGHVLKTSNYLTALTNKPYFRARAAYPTRYKKDNILFFLVYSAETTKWRKEMADPWKKMESLGPQRFLLYK